MSLKEATARIKINKLLESAGWRFFADGNTPANISLEPGVALKTQDLDALGNFGAIKGLSTSFCWIPKAFR
jgi:type I restriction enzyme R subunit